MEKIKAKHDDEVQAAISAKLDEVNKAHLAQIESLKAQISEESSIQVQRELEVFKDKALKVRGDLTAAHKVELERVRSEMAISFEQSQSDHRASTKQVHEAELQRIKEESQINLSEQIEQTKREVENQLLKVMDNKLKEQVESHKAEIDRLRATSSEDISVLKQESQSLAAALSTKEAALQDSEAVIENLKSSYSKQLETIQAQHSSEKASLEAAIRQEMEEKQRSLLSDATSSAAVALQKELNDIIATYKQELDKVRNDAADEKAKLAADMEHTFNKKLQEMAAVATSTTAAEVASVRKDLEAEINKQRRDLLNAKEAEIRKLKVEWESLSAQALEKSEHAALSKLEALRTDLYQQLTESQQKAQQLAGDLSQAQRQQESLQGELQDLRANAAAANQDKAAVMAAAKDGEASSSKKLEEALTQQRVTFEEQMKAMKESILKGD